MALPRVLGLNDVADAAALCGVGVDRVNVAHALRPHAIDGVTPAPRRGTPWRIERRALLDALAAVLHRRAMRELARAGARPRPLADYRLDAAERMLDDPELAALVPRRLARQVERRAAARAEAARQRREEEERVRRAVAAAVAARERARRAAEMQRGQKLMARVEAEQLERELARAYQDATRVALEDYRRWWAARGVNVRPPAPGWKDHMARFRAEWPDTRPSWWAPPPGMIEELRAIRARYGGCLPYDWTLDDFRRWVPPYVPGQPWPWRRDEAKCNQDVPDAA